VHRFCKKSEELLAIFGVKSHYFPNITVFEQTDLFDLAYFWGEKDTIFLKKLFPIKRNKIFFVSY